MDDNYLMSLGQQRGQPQEPQYYGQFFGVTPTPGAYGPYATPCKPEGGESGPPTTTPSTHVDSTGHQNHLQLKRVDSSVDSSQFGTDINHIQSFGWPSAKSTTLSTDVAFSPWKKQKISTTSN